MRKEIRDVDEKRGIVQVTIADERWYFKPGKSETGIPVYIAVPSVTFIADSYPKGIGFYKWLADKGWDESESLKQVAADKGSKIHLAISSILKGEEVRIDSKFLNKSTDKEEELTLEECDGILGFIQWKKDTEKEFLVEPVIWDTVVFSEQHNYAGSLDAIFKLTHKETKEVEFWLVDFKSGQYIWPTYQLQVSAYRRAIVNGENNFPNVDPTSLKMAVLQIGYKRAKSGYKFTPIEDKFDLFLAAQKIWKEEHSDENPTKKDYPIILSPAITAEDVELEAPEEISVDSVELPINKKKNGGKH